MRKIPVKSIFFFALVTFLPLLKVFLLGQTDDTQQDKFIRIYFWIQFLVPIVDFGYYWSQVRKKITSNDNDGFYGISLVGALIGSLLLPLDLLYFQMLLLITATALYNFRLQIFRIEGDTRSYYLVRMTKVLIDMTLVVTLYFNYVLSVEFLLTIELFSVVVSIITSFKSTNRSFVGFGKIFTFDCTRFFSLDYLYMLLSVVRSNFVRILLPVMFTNQGIEAVLFAVLFYELIGQYLSIEKLKDLLENRINVTACLILYLMSIPIQAFCVYFLAIIMGWEFGIIDITCVILGGGARIFSVYTLNAVKKNQFGLVVSLNTFFVVFCVVSAFVIYYFDVGENAAKLTLLFFYSAEALIGLILIVLLECSNFIKRS